MKARVLEASRARFTAPIALAAIGLAAALGAARLGPIAGQWASAQAQERLALEVQLRDATGPDALREQKLREVARIEASVDSAVKQLMTGATPSEAATAMLRHVERLASQAGVEVRSIEVGSDSTFDGGLAVATLLLAAESDVFALVALLAAIEGDRSLIAVERAQVLQPNPTLTSDEKSRLRFDLQLRAIVARAGERH